MTANGVLGERADPLQVSLGREVLEGANPDVAGGYPCEDRAGQRGLAVYRFAGSHHCEAARGGDAECVHRLADNIFPQHGSQHRAPVAAARKRRPSRAFELDVKAFARGCEVLAQQVGPAIAKHGEMPELMPCIGLADRLRTFGDAVA